MPDVYPLQGESVVFTGTLKSEDAFERVKTLGGQPLSFPLIQVAERFADTDEQRLQKAQQVDWLIFTSQNAVRYFHEKMKRFSMSSELFTGRIAAVGTKTAAALERIGFQVCFIPTVFSADVFVQQFQPQSDRPLHALFLRGNLASCIIREQLPFHVEEWTLYETKQKEEETNQLTQFIRTHDNVSILFASPSAVEVFAKHIAPICGWERITVCAIGHVTERALKNVGAEVDVVPETYTFIELVHALARRKEEKST